MKNKTVPPKANASRPTPTELINFCRDIGLDLFGVELRAQIASIIASIKSPKTDPANKQKLLEQAARDYEALVREARSDRAGSVEDKLRLALSWWTDVVHIAAGVIDEERVPAEFAKDARLKFRWLHLKNILVPKCVEEDAELQWQISFDEDWAISEEDALQLTGFRSENRMYAAFRSFGCPSGLRDLTIYAVGQLLSLDDTWVKVLNKKRVADNRRREKKNE